MNIKRIKKRYSLEKIVPLMINDMSIRAEPDSGADVNVMDEITVSCITTQVSRSDGAKKRSSS